MTDFSSSRGEKFTFVASDQKALALAREGRGGVLQWATLVSDRLRREVEEGSVKLLRVEDAFIRSAGLGVDLARPWSLVFDDVGIYYDSDSPSRLEKILVETTFSDALLERAEGLRQEIVLKELTKYNVNGDDFHIDACDRKIVLVPGQVEDDQSVLCGSPNVRTNLELLKLVRRENPQAYIIYKPHPDVHTGLRCGEIALHLNTEYCDQVVTNVSISSIYDHIDEVHTMTSLAGFEALLRGRRVVTYGAPFYAGWGLTEDRIELPRRSRKLSLSELVAGALICYPVYVDPNSREICTPENLLAVLGRSKNGARCWHVWAIRFVRKTWLNCKHEMVKLLDSILP